MREKSTQSVSCAAVLVGLVLGLAAFDSFAVRAVLLAVCPFVPHRSTSSISIVRFVRRRSRSTPSPRRHASSTSPQSRPRARRPVSSHPRLCRASCVPLRWFLYDWLCAVWLVDFAIARRSLGYVARSIKTARASRCARVGPTGWGVKTLMIDCDVFDARRARSVFSSRGREKDGHQERPENGQGRPRAGVRHRAGAILPIHRQGTRRIERTRRSRIAPRSSDDARARTARRWTIERDDVGGDECERIRAHRSSSRETTRGRSGVDDGARRGRRVER